MASQPIPLRFAEPHPRPFNFPATVNSHGWVELAPFSWDQDRATLTRPIELDTGTLVELSLRPWRNSISGVASSARPLTAAERSLLSRATRRMLRLDEDLGAFTRLAAGRSDHTMRLAPGAGRILRCPSLFEDIVCVLCTTNIAWSGTRRMVSRLVEQLGTPLPHDPEKRAFPLPRAVAEAGPEFLRQQVGLGYRSEYVWGFAHKVAQGALDLAVLEASGRPTAELRAELLAIKGIGPYAAATILMLLGRYGHLPIDSAMRSFVGNKYYQGQTPSDEQIQAIYAPWGDWRYLAYWFDSG